jgi:mRNA-degrading endonuclease RelE of RelBE toxin-antitoxin system
MRFSVFLHPDVEKYIDSLSENERKRCYISLKKLMDDPYKPRSKCDIKKLSSNNPFYRLRVENNRFLYIIKQNEVFIEEAFNRKKGYNNRKNIASIEE